MIGQLAVKVTVSAVCAFAMIGLSYGFDPCGSLNNRYGPFDYWTDKDKLGIVEVAHFTPEVENLRAGKSSTIGGDIDYTLRAFPNHPRALLSIVRLGERRKSERPPGARYTVACYLERAVRFRPNDGTVRMIYGTYLAKRKKYDEALVHLKVAEEGAQDNANLHYNLGLLYFDLEKFEESLKHAHVAYRLGFSLPGLRNKLEKAGKWADPLPPPAIEETPAQTQN
ncbi:MAG: tetratricopeptide repeat protein [Pseudomonadota bacterium]